MARFNRSSAGEYAYRVNSVSTYPDNGDWIHFAATCDGSAIRLYVNGELESELAVPFTIQNPSTQIRFGGCGATSIDIRCDPEAAFDGASEDEALQPRTAQAEIQARLAIPEGAQ